MVSPARSAAYEVLCRVELGGAFCDQLLSSKLLAQADERDRNLATEMCYGTLRWRLALDDLLGRTSARPWEKVDARARILLRIGLYQLWHTDRVPDHALVNDAVEIAKHRLGRGCAGFVNGILRSLARERPWEKDGFDAARPDWVRASLPEWLWKRWLDRHGREQALEYALSLNRPPQCAAWDCRRPDGVSSIVGSPSPVVPGALLFDRRPEDRHLWMQDEASQYIPHLLGPVAGGRIWDCCAAPGGKTGILSSLCGADGFVIASDLSIKRAGHMKGPLGRLGWKKPAVLVADATASCPFRDGSFDAVLADVPCSGLGTLRRNPEIKWRFDPGRLAALQRRQVSILDAVSGAVRRGGVLLYSTCSTEPEENEQVINAFLASHRYFELRRPDVPQGVERWLDPVGLLRTYPSERRWDGFFAALMFRFS